MESNNCLRTLLFPIGRVVLTPGARAILLQFDMIPQDLLSRHETGDFGDLCEEDKQANREAIRDGDEILSAYKLSPITKLWVVTEGDHSITTITTPEEY